jgi:uncharacterized protein YndB with AHSA1/START domain
MSPASTDRIERKILLRAPRSQVWRALTNPVEFGTWFGVKVEGTFAPGARDYSSEPTTLVVFELEDAGGGTMLTVVESGFDQVPLARRAQAYRMNGEGWTYQMQAIEGYVATAR